MKRFFRMVGLVILCVMGSVLLLVAVAYSMGTVTVAVDEKRPEGHHLYVPVPAIVIPLGVRLAPPGDLADAAVEVRPWLPAIKAASEELARCPDTTLVEVTDSEEKVRIAKRGDSIVVDVDGQEESVHVSVPLGTAYTLASQFESLPDRVSSSAGHHSKAIVTDMATSN